MVNFILVRILYSVSCVIIIIYFTETMDPIIVAFTTLVDAVMACLPPRFNPNNKDNLLYYLFERVPGLNRVSMLFFISKYINFYLILYKVMGIYCAWPSRLWMAL